MSAKYVYSLSDKNPDLQKHIGCMNGFFHLFDRHHFFLSGGRRIMGQSPKRLPSGPNGYMVAHSKIASQKTTEKKRKEKQRISTESSRTSFSSSSCSSSVSSLECIKASQLEQASISQTNVAKVHARNSPVYQPNSPLQSQQSPDLRDVVKDSIYREPRGLSIKRASKGNAGGQTLKYIDSPRPLQQPKSVSPKVSGQKESFRVLHKLQEAPCKSISLSSSAIDAPRFSYDGRESRDMLKSTIKAKELPRLSLDSRAGSVRGSTTEMESNYLSDALKRRNEKTGNLQNQEQEPGSLTRPSSVVAKLMGLEAFPDHSSTNGNKMSQLKTNPDVKNNSLSASSRTSSDMKQNHISAGSPKILHGEPLSPNLRNLGSIKNPTASIKSPIELAPWKQSDGTRGSHLPASKTQLTQTKAPNSSLSVYGEIEKRLAQLEFKKSGKDLRALKQILEAMQKTKEILETRNEASNIVCQTNNIINIDPNSNFPSLRDLQFRSCISTPTKGTGSPKCSKSSIVIMKPPKIIGNASSPAASWCQTCDSDAKESSNKQIARDLIPRTNHLRVPSNQPLCPMSKGNGSKLVRSAQTSKEPQSTSRETNNSAKTSGTVNLRQQQRKLGLEKSIRPKPPSSDSTRTGRKSNRLITESGSQCRKSKPKFPNMQSSDDELSETSSDVRDSHHQLVSMKSESNISLVSQIDEEVSSTYRCEKINSSFIQETNWRQNSPEARSNKDGSTAELAISSSQQPSPVSVLDAAFYSDELPSPIKKISMVFQDDDTPNSDEVERNGMDLGHTSINLNSGFSSMVEHKKVEIIKPLIKNLKQMLSVHEGSICDENTPIFNSTNPDHQYISELLLLSGLLKDFESNFMDIHLHPASYPISPDLFIVLEQANASTMQLNDECSIKRKASSDTNDIIHRELMFDVVNEILVEKLILDGSSKKWLSPNVLAYKRPRGQQLWEELCREVDRLQGINSNCIDSEGDFLNNIFSADMMQQSMHWIAHPGEIPGLVLDIERLIFKDLISEIVDGEAIGLQGRSARYRRQLFSKLLVGRSFQT